MTNKYQSIPTIKGSIPKELQPVLLAVRNTLNLLTGQTGRDPVVTLADLSAETARINALLAGLNSDGVGMFETWDSRTSDDWYGNRDEGVITFPQSGSMGGYSFNSSGGTDWRVYKNLIPYNSNWIYRITARVRQRRIDTIGSANLLYLGVTGVASDGKTLINSNGTDAFGSAHYVGVSAYDMSAHAIDEWVVFNGYFSGYGAYAPGNSKNSPSLLTNGIAYIRPTFLLNYNGGDGEMEVDYVAVEVVSVGIDGIDGARGDDANGIEYIFAKYNAPILPASKEPDDTWGYDSPATIDSLAWSDGAPDLDAINVYLYRSQRKIQGAPVIDEAVTDLWTVPVVVGRYGVNGDDGYSNILDPTQWVVGSTGSQGDFVRNGADDENAIILDVGAFGYSEALWECKTNSAADSGADGGWINDIALDRYDTTKTHRYTVLAKQDSNNGTVYLGCRSAFNISLTANTNPYFWNGDLPELDKWFLIVGYLHGSSYTGATSGKSGVYSLETGQQVIVGTDFICNPANIQRHRAYWYYSIDTAATCHFSRPRLDEVNGNEPSLSDLLGRLSLDGADGIDGLDGTSGNTVAQLTIYRRDSIVPDQPTGGSYNFDTDVITAPAGWSAFIPDGTEPAYSCVGIASIVGIGGTDSDIPWGNPSVALYNGAGTYNLVSTANTIITPTSVTGLSDTDWISGAYSLESYDGASFVSCNMIRGGDRLMMGLSKDDGTSAHYNTIDYAVYRTAGNVFNVYELGSNKGVFGAITDTDLISVVNNGVDVQYKLNGVTVYTSITAPSGAYRFDCSFAGIDDAVTNIAFGPMGRVGDDGSDGDNGSDGSNGLSIYQAIVFRRSATVPATPNANSGSYDFGTNTLTPPANWSVSPPEGASPLYASQATFEIQGSTGVDSTQSWTDSALFVQDGDDGVDGQSTYMFIVYQRATSEPAVPTGGNFDFGLNVGAPPAGWEVSIGDTVGSDPIYVTQALASVSGDTGIDNSLTWGSVGLLSENGQDGLGANPILNSTSDPETGLTHVSVGNGILITWNFSENSETSFSTNDQPTGFITLNLQRNGITIDTTQVLSTFDSDAGEGYWEYGSLIRSLNDTPGVGTHTYTVTNNQNSTDVVESSGGIITTREEQ